MIHVDRHGIHIKGQKVNLQVQLTSVMHEMVQQGIFDKEELVEMVSLALMSDKERKQLLADMEKELFGDYADEIHKLMEEILGK